MLLFVACGESVNNSFESNSLQVLVVAVLLSKKAESLNTKNLHHKDDTKVEMFSSWLSY